MQGVDLSQFPYQVLDVYRRTAPNFIQGLYWDPKNRRLLESTSLKAGWNGSKESRTQWRKINQETKATETLVKEDYDKKHFGEGITPLTDNTLIEMTWKEGVVKLLDSETLKEKKQIKMWPGVKEGWGITLDPVK